MVVGGGESDLLWGGLYANSHTFEELQRELVKNKSWETSKKRLVLAITSCIQLATKYTIEQTALKNCRQLEIQLYWNLIRSSTVEFPVVCKFKTYPKKLAAGRS